MAWYIYMYVHCNVMQRFTLVMLCYSINSYAGTCIVVTGNRLTNILNINYSYISAYTIIIKIIKLTSNNREKKGEEGGGGRMGGGGVKIMTSTSK